MNMNGETSRQNRFCRETDTLADRQTDRASSVVTVLGIFMLPTGGALPKIIIKCNHEVVT